MLSLVLCLLQSDFPLPVGITARVSRRAKYGIMHILAHGGVSTLGTADGPVSEAELVTLMESQGCLQFVVVAACDSYVLVGGFHNALHAPSIGYNAPIDDRAAVEVQPGVSPGLAAERRRGSRGRAGA